MRRTNRRVAAWLVLLGLFLAQLATVAHACAWVDPALASVPAEPVHMSAPCDGMDAPGTTDATALCADHCQSGSEAVNNAPVDHRQAPVSQALVVVVPASALPLARLRSESLLARTTAPPLFASSSRLRI